MRFGVTVATVKAAAVASCAAPFAFEPDRLPDGRTLIAVEPDSEPIPEDRPFVVRVRRPRNPKHHRMYWGMLTSVAHATGRWMTAESLHRWLKLELGYYTIVGLHEGKTVVEMTSTDFMGMDQARFQEFFDLVVAAICLETGIDVDDLERHLDDSVR